MTNEDQDPAICVICGKKAHALFFCKKHDPSNRELDKEKGLLDITNEYLQETQQSRNLDTSKCELNLSQSKDDTPK